MNGKININERLITALSFMDKCKVMADIGSDHGYGSIYALQNGIADSVIATDISAPSLAKTERLVTEYLLSDKISCRVGDGFYPILPGEADTALIAGMGSELIADIVEKGSNVAKELCSMVLQPMNTAEPLRRRLIKLGYKIDAEGIVIDNMKYYQILKCSCGCMELSEIQYELGSFVYNEKISNCDKYIAHMIAQYEGIVAYIGKNDTEAANIKLAEAEKRICKYRRALEWAMQG